MIRWLQSLPSVPYPRAGDGYWLPVTSTINWCEEDYYATRYSAEIVNSVTNVIFVLLALKGLTNCYLNGHDRVFMVTFGGYAAVGTGSFLFHSTLKYPMQLVDELSMIYTTCFSCYGSFTYRRSRLYSLFVALTLFGLAAFITGYYHYIQDPRFHQRMYALLTATVLLRSMFVMELNIRPSLRRRRAAHAKEREVGVVGSTTAAEQARQDARDEAILRTMWAMIAYGLAIFLGGFAIWTLDNELCSSLRSWRRQLGLPWGILLEGHGWWHIMTGIGAYFYITWGIWLRHCLNGKQDLYELRWPRLVTSLPVLVRREKTPEVEARVAKSTGIQNGSVTATSVTRRR